MPTARSNSGARQMTQLAQFLRVDSLQPLPPAPPDLLQRRSRAGAEHEQVPGRTRPGPRSLCRRVGLGNHDVPVGASESEGAHTGDQTLPRIRPLGRVGLHFDGNVLEGNEWVGFVEVQARRQPAMAHREDDLDQSGDAGRGLEMTDVALDRADATGSRLGVRRRQRPCERLDLDGIAEPRSGAVRLEILRRRGAHARGRKGSADELGLCVRVGRGQAVAAAVLVDRRAEDHGLDAVVRCDGVLEPLEHDDAGPLAADVAVGTGIERFAAAVRRQKPGPRERHREPRPQE